MLRPGALSTPFPYTTLFRSIDISLGGCLHAGERFLGQTCLSADRGDLRGKVDLVENEFERFPDSADTLADLFDRRDQKSTRLNSSHVEISYAVFCLKKKNIR